MKMIRKGLCAFLRSDGYCFIRRKNCDKEHDYAPCKDAVRRVIRRHEVVVKKMLDYHLESASNRFKKHTENIRGADVYWACKRKGRYRNQSDAQKASRKMTLRYGVQMYSYFCKFCQGWHLTKKARKGEESAL